MTNFMRTSVKRFGLIKAAREIKQEIEKVPVKDLKILVDAGTSILHTYLNGCSAQEKARMKRDLHVLQRVGVTADMLVTELTRQMPELGSIIRSRKDYLESEVQKVMAFMQES